MECLVGSVLVVSLEQADKQGSKSQDSGDNTGKRTGIHSATAALDDGEVVLPGVATAVADIVGGG